MERHHIIFKSQLGLDFPLNYKKLSSEDHRGNNGPHKNRKVDLLYKKELEDKLRTVLTNKHYTVDEVIDKLELKPKQAYKAFKQIRKTSKGMNREEVIKRLLGGRYYL